MGGDGGAGDGGVAGDGGGGAVPGGFHACKVQGDGGAVFADEALVAGGVGVGVVHAGCGVALQSLLWVVRRTPLPNQACQGTHQTKNAKRDHEYPKDG